MAGCAGHRLIMPSWRNPKPRSAACSSKARADSQIYAVPDSRQHPTTTRCPFKGTASYYTITQNGQRYVDAIWSYEEPLDERAALKGRMAFYDDKHPRIRVVAGGAAA